MSIINRLQKALGFSYEDETAELPATVPDMGNGAGITVMRHDMPPETTDTNKRASGAYTGNSGDSSHDNSGYDASVIFKGVVEMLNRELPAYLRKCLDEEQQCRLMLENIDTSTKEYIAALVANEKEKIRLNRENERDRQRRNSDELKEQLRQCRDQLAKETDKTMSAERQKRALSARIKDLEEKVAALNAEKEQFELENRSLLNKLRVAEVKSQFADTEAAAERDAAKDRTIETLRAEIDVLKASAVDAENLATQIASLKPQADEALSLKSELHKIRDDYRKVLSDYEALVIENRRLNDICTAKENRAEYNYDEFIAFDTNVTASDSEPAVEPAADQEPQVVAPGDDIEKKIADSSCDSARTKSRRGRPRKKSETDKPDKNSDKVDILSDIDWLISDTGESDALTPTGNPDRLVADGPFASPGYPIGTDKTADAAPEGEESKETSDGFPEQMSLW